MVRERYYGGGMTQLIYVEDIPQKDLEMKQIRLYARDLLAEIKLLTVAALFIFGLIFAVPMVRHTATYLIYWSLTAVFTFRVLWQKYRRPKKKSHSRAKTMTPKRIK